MQEGHCEYEGGGGRGGGGGQAETVRESGANLLDYARMLR